MVIEQILPPKELLKHPVESFPLGIGLAILGILLGVLFFKIDAAIMGIVLVTIASVPFLSKILDIEAVKEGQARSIKQLVLRNKKIITIYFAFFVGIATGYFLIYSFFPGNAMQSVFDAQSSIFIRNDISTSPTIGFSWEIFHQILQNNIGVILICLLLSFLYGAGAILVLTWNASVLGIFLASIPKARIVAFVTPHVLLEFLSFFIAAVAGGLICVAINKHKTKSRAFKTIVADSLILVILSLILIISAALVETYVIALL